MLEVKQPGEPAHRHEAKDVSFWKILAVTGAFVIVIGIVALLVAWLYQYLGQVMPAESSLGIPVTGRVKVPPPPRLQSNPSLDLKKFREAEEGTLHGYGVLDPDTGAVHIPIERAIELTAQRGLPSRPPSAAQAAAGQPATAQSSAAVSGPGSSQYVPGPGPYADAPPAPGAIPPQGLMAPLRGGGKQ